MAIPSKINVTEYYVTKDNFTEYPYDWKLIFQIHFDESILPEWCKIRKIFSKYFKEKFLPHDQEEEHVSYSASLRVSVNLKKHKSERTWLPMRSDRVYTLAARKTEEKQ